ERCLSRARRTHDGYQLPGTHGEVEIRERLHSQLAGAIDLRDTLGDGPRRGGLWQTARLGGAKGVVSCLVVPPVGRSLACRPWEGGLHVDRLDRGGPISGRRPFAVAKALLHQ